jgi:predicted anti-sigma-YlaC factor YlaD
VDPCSEWRELASSHLDGELDELRTAQLERHLLGCEPCRSWTREIAVLADALHESTTLCPAPSLELRTQTLRRKLARSASAASAASVAAAAAFAIALPGAISLFSSGRTPSVSSAPCASCMKKKALTFTDPASAVAVGPVHVAHPLDNSA